MPRVKWAVKCTARRSNGSPCGSWSVRGAYVCQTHGGALWRTRQAAAVRLSELVMRKAFSVAQAKHERQFIAFHAQRILITSDLMGIPVEEVDQSDMFECLCQFGRPAPSWEAPQLRDVPLDGRFKRFFQLESAVPKRHRVRGGQ